MKTLELLREHNPERIAVDCETTSLDWRTGHLLGFSLAWRTPDGEIASCYVAVGHKENLWEQNADPDYAREILWFVMGREQIFHTAPFDRNFLRAFYPAYDTPRYTDVHEFARLLGADATDRAGLTLNVLDLYRERVGISEGQYDALYLLKQHRSSIAEMWPSEVEAYARADALMTLRLCEELGKMLSEREENLRLWITERQFSRLLLEMSDRGVRVNREVVGQYIGQFKERSREIEKLLLSEGLCGLGIRDVEARFLYDTLKIPCPALTPTGKRSVGRAALEAISEYPAARLVLEWRQYSKALGTWLYPLLRKRDKDGRVRPRWDGAGARSGRISCKDPNLQAIPLHDRDALSYGALEGIFYGAPGFDLVAFDYKQADLRLATLVAKEHRMAAILADQDPYMAMARVIWGVESPTTRHKAKQFTLATLYSMGPAAAMKVFDMDEAQAKQALKEYRSTFPGFGRASRWFSNKAAGTEYVTLWTGRRVRLSQWDREQDPHKAFNRIVQGGVAEMVKWAMLEIRDLLGDYQSKQVVQVHDSIVVELAHDETIELRPLIIERMERALPKSLRIRTDPPVNMAVEVEPWG